jgi:hypothetical protein
MLSSNLLKNMQKIHTHKFIDGKPLHTVITVTNSIFGHFLLITFLKNFQRIRNQHQILRFYTHMAFVFHHISTFYKILLQTRTKRLKKLLLKTCLKFCNHQRHGRTKLLKSLNPIAHAHYSVFCFISRFPASSVCLALIKVDICLYCFNRKRTGLCTR